MEQSVYALVQHRDDGRFAIVETDNGELRLPTATIDVGESLLKAKTVQLKGLKLYARPDAHLGADQNSLYYSFTVVSGKLSPLDGSLKARWMSAAEILTREAQPKFGPIDPLLLRALAQASPENV